jgi:DNA-binding IclR family transcriptional regulator
MSSTLIRGLSLLEAIDLSGPITVMDLVRLTGVDKSMVSRTLRALEGDGWVVRDHGKVEVGPRAALLGHASTGARMLREAEPLVHAVAGVTGMLTQVYGLVGTRAVVLAAAGGRGPETLAGLASSVPLHLTAAGMTVASQLPTEELDPRLPREPYPDPVAEFAGQASFDSIVGAVGVPVDASSPPGVRFARDRAELDRLLDPIRREGIAFDRAEVFPPVGCISLAWTNAALPAAFVCMGLWVELAAAEPLIRASIGAALAPGARPQDIVAAAAATMEAEQ